MARTPMFDSNELLEAGRRAFERGSAEVKIADVVPIQVADVLDEVSKDANTRRLSPSVFYTHWDSLEAYLQELVPMLFNPTDLDLSALNETGPLPERLIKHARADIEHAAGQSASAYYGAFAGVEIPAVQHALDTVYQSYDEILMPEIRAALERSGCPITQERLQTFAAALTAITEGLVLRKLAQPALETEPVIRLVIPALLKELEIDE